MKTGMYVVGALLIAGMLLLAALPEPTAQKDTLKKFASYDELKGFVKSNIEDYSFYGASADVARDVQTTQTPAPAKAGVEYSATNIQVEGVDEADIVKNDGRYIYTVSGSKVVVIDAYPAEDARIVSQIDVDNTGTREIFINNDRLIVFGNEYTYRTLGEAGSAEISVPYYDTQTSFIKVYDISDRANPLLVKNISADGYYSNSRMIGDYVYAVVSQPVYTHYGEIPLPLVSPAKGFPDIYYFDVPGGSYNFINIIALNTQTDEDPVTKVYMLPSSQGIFVSKDSIYLTYTKWLDYRDFFDRVLDEVLIPTVPSLADEINGIRNQDISNSEKSARVGEALEDYFGQLGPEDSVTVATDLQESMAALQRDIAKEREKTIIHKISISGPDIEYRGQGSVPGHVLNQFSMDEHGGYFRIATTTSAGFGVMVSEPALVGEQVAATQTAEKPLAEPVEPSARPAAAQAVPPDAPTKEAPQNPSEIIREPAAAMRPIVAPPPASANNLYVLDSSMNTVGKVEDLAPGERIYSVRFMADRAYMVTFRQVDPLFVIDLRNPARPAVLGFLKITGFSDYLHPVAEDRIIGIGKEATEQGLFQGLKMSLFDVSDVENPKEISKFVIGDRGTDSHALHDHRAFLFDPSKDLLVLPVLLAEIDRSKPPGDWAYGEYKWQGAYVFSLENGFKVRGRVGHAADGAEGYETYYGQYSVKRSLYIGDVLYTISDRMIKANSLSDLGEIKSLVI